MRLFTGLMAALVLMGFSAGWTQAQEPAETTLRMESREVLVDVLVTDKNGKPVHGLPQSVFQVEEQGKPQNVSFFEEHASARKSDEAVELPVLPPNTFTNVSPFPDPPAVTVLLLDSLNTQMSDQSYVHAQAMKFLSTAKPGSRMAIFTMGLGLHFIQGFNDDPAVLMAALKNPKNNEVESSVMLKSGSETDAQTHLVGMMSAGVSTPGGTVSSASASSIAALGNFIQENDVSQGKDRMWVTLENLQRLARFLEGFPGRKNIVWFAEAVPNVFAGGTTSDGADSSLEQMVRKTESMLTSARAALYPVQPSGVSNYSSYTAEVNMAHSATQGSDLLGANGGFARALTDEGNGRYANQAGAQRLAEDSGGKAFANTNDLSRVMTDVAATSGDFYSLAYAPTNSKMDGQYRSIRIKLASGDYKLSYRRGYFASEDSLPGGSMRLRQAKLEKITEQNQAGVDPLLPFMDLGMPQTQQVKYKAKIDVVPAGAADSAEESKRTHYAVNFRVDVNDLTFKQDEAGRRQGKLNLSLVVYDRYGNIVTRKDNVVLLNLQPDEYSDAQDDGLVLHGAISVPKGNYWLRTGVYDWASDRAGTMEVPLAAVQPMPVLQR